MTNIRQFCLSNILKYSESNFDFDISTITKENLNDCIEEISRDLFSQRPITLPYVHITLTLKSVTITMLSERLTRRYYGEYIRKN